MSSRLSTYESPPSIRSPLFTSPTDVVPPTDELESLHNELRLLKQKTLARARKAGEDLRTIEESMRRMKEKEKGKARAIDKVKRERDFTPLPEADEPRLSNSLHSVPLHSLPPSSSRSSLDPRRSAADDYKKKKKKRKRETGESDGEQDTHRPRKISSPAPQHAHPTKALKFNPSSSSAASKPILPPPISGPDFSVPPSMPLLPPRPPIPLPPIPGPSMPTEVKEDFSKSKQPAQILVNSFYTSIEPWIRGIKEEDVGFLEYTGDEVEPYVMPKLGQHYLEVWEDEDNGIVPIGTSLSGTQVAPVSSLTLPPVPKWDPSTLMEQDLVTEEKGHGPLTERLISALLPIPDANGWKGVKAAEDAMEGRPGGSAAAAARKERMNVSDLEERIKDTMRHHGLLKSPPDFSEKVDDPIATALRHAQKELRTVVATNKKRKERLAAIARDRLGYQEYIDLRDSIDRNITNTFSKLQKKDVPKLGKKKKKLNDPSVNGTPSGTMTPAGVPPPCPAALGLGPDDNNKLVLSEQLRQLVDTRRQWVDAVGGVFDEKQRENPGRIWGLPKQSVYEGIDEEVRLMLSVPTPDSERRTNKGKGKARGDEMEVG